MNRTLVYLVHQAIARRLSREDRMELRKVQRNLNEIIRKNYTGGTGSTEGSTLTRIAMTSASHTMTDQVAIALDQSVY
jgi:hypothetical protein